jgi:hypothetical protein
MQKEQKESFAERIVKITENLRDPLVQGEKRSRFIAGEGIAYSLNDSCLDLWDSILSDLLIKNGWNKKFSEKYVDSKLHEIISKIVKDGNSQKALDYFDQLIDEYEQYSTEHILHIPLFGIELNEEPIKLGNVILKKIDNICTEDLISRYKQAISKSSHSDDEKIWFVEQEKERIDKFLRNRVCAIIIVQY